jgi:class 3 adenylate cyclase
MIAYRLDREMQALARRFGCRYSRYADDLTISCTRDVFPPALARRDDNLRVELGAELVRVVEGNDFGINPKKTRLSSRQQRQVVTGVKVNSHLNVDRRYVRRIRGMLHAWDKYGVDAAQAHLEQHYTKDRYPGAAPRFTTVLRGRIEYLRMIRGPGDPLAQRFLDQFDNLANRRALNEGIHYTAPQTQRKGARAPDRGESRQLLTVMFTDVVSSTNQLVAQGDREWGQLTDEHFHHIRMAVTGNRGRVIKTIGDGTLSTFPSASDGLGAAIRSLRGSLDQGLSVRIGLHTGEVERVGDDVEGVGVNVASRICDLALAGEVLVSATLQELVAGNQFAFHNVGRFSLKGLPGRRPLFALVHESIPRTSARAMWKRRLKASH